MNERIKKFIAGHKEETMIFCLVFIVVLSSFRFAVLDSAMGHVEQWHNLVNGMFYGQQDMLFSFGPLYWLMGRYVKPYNEWTYGLTLAMVSAFSALVWTVLFSLSYRAKSVLFLAVSFFIFFDGLALDMAVLYVSLVIICYLEYSRPGVIEWGARTWLIIGFFAGVCFYIRFVMGLVIAGSLILYLISVSLTSRRINTVLALMGGVLLGYFLGGLWIFHQAVSLIDYFFINNQLSFSNSVDMTTGLANTTGSFVAIMVIGIAFNVYIFKKRRVLLLPINFMMLIFFKWGFSRTDHHMQYFIVPMAVLSFLMLLDGSRVGRVAFIVVTSLLFYLSAVPAFPGAVLRNKWAPALEAHAVYSQRLKQDYAAFTLDAEFVRQIGQETIDVYPYKNEYMFANGFNYWHRPAFQNYMTLTPALDNLNKDFLKSVQRPEFVLWTGGAFCLSSGCNVFEAFDEKYVLNEDPLTSSSLLLNYHVVQVGQGRHEEPVALFKANEHVAPDSLHVASPMEMRLGEWYPVPAMAGGVVKLLPRLEFTWLGKIKNLLFRGSVVMINYRLGSGEVRRYRLNILNAGSGVWVSPLLDRFDFSGERVDAIMIESTLAGYLQPVFTAAWATLKTDLVSTRAVYYSAVTEPASAAGEPIRSDCSGALDAANEYLPVPASIKADKTLSLRGWLARSTDEGRLFDQVLVTLTDAKGQQTFLSADSMPRVDLIGVFNKPQLANAGFRAAIDLTGFKGSYILGLAGISESRLYLCNQFNVQVQIP